MTQERLKLVGTLEGVRLYAINDRRPDTERAIERASELLRRAFKALYGQALRPVEEEPAPDPSNEAVTAWQNRTCAEIRKLAKHPTNRAAIAAVADGAKMMRGYPTEPAPASRWVRLAKVSNSGCVLYVCTVCGRESKTPDKTCGEHAKDGFGNVIDCADVERQRRSGAEQPAPASAGLLAAAEEAVRQIPLSSVTGWVRAPALKLLRDAIAAEKARKPMPEEHNSALSTQLDYYKSDLDRIRSTVDPDDDSDEKTADLVVSTIADLREQVGRLERLKAQHEINMAASQKVNDEMRERNGDDVLREWDRYDDAAKRGFEWEEDDDALAELCRRALPTEPAPDIGIPITPKSLEDLSRLQKLAEGLPSVPASQVELERRFVYAIVTGLANAGMDISIGAHHISKVYNDPKTEHAVRTIIESGAYL